MTAVSRSALSRPGVRGLVLAVAAAVAATGCGSSDETAKKNGPAECVALGDSYTAGPGIAPVADLRCRRSKINYPSLVATATTYSGFDDRSCSGASTLDLDKPQMDGDTSLNPPQLDAVDAKTRLVTVGLGLNNNAVSVGLLLVCLNPDGGSVSDRCERYLATPQSTIDRQIELSASQVAASLQEIRKRAPRARVLLVGYPRLVPDTGDCPDRLPVPTAQVERMRIGMRTVDEAWARAARQAGATYIDMYAPSEGHDICSDDPWVADQRGPSLGEGVRLHPIPSYHRAVAAQIEAALTA